MAPTARTRYTTSGDVDIAYQVLGDGPIDVLLYTGFSFPIDLMDEEPAMARFQRRLASIGRVLRFDTRGVGLSDRGSPSDPPTHEHWARDAIAVMDAAGSERAAVLAPWGNSPAGLVLAATHPDRISHLVVMNGSARPTWAEDNPHGLPDAGHVTSYLQMDAADALEQGFDILGLLSPMAGNDPAFRAWWDRAGNLGATPAMARAIWAGIIRTDVRGVLPRIGVPTLVVQRADNPLLVVGHGQYLAAHIAGAKLVELAGDDLLYWVGDTGPMLDEIEEFLTGVRSGSGAERVLATVLFTDIVGSTDQAAQLGDGRWRDLLDRHDHSVRTQIERFSGRAVKTVGDGFVATFASPGRGIECAVAIRDRLRDFGLVVRAGLHTGEIEVRGDDVAGLAVHIGARVASLAGPDEILVSSTVKDLVVGSSVEFLARGEHELKGVPGTWRLYAVAP